MNFPRLKDSVCKLMSSNAKKNYVPSFSLGDARFSIYPFPLEPTCPGIVIWKTTTITEKNPKPFNCHDLQGQSRRKPWWGKKAQKYTEIWVLVLSLTNPGSENFISSYLSKFFYVLKSGPKNLMKFNEAVILGFIWPRKFTVGRCFLGHYY